MCRRVFPLASSGSTFSLILDTQTLPNLAIIYAPSSTTCGFLHPSNHDWRPHSSDAMEKHTHGLCHVPRYFSSACVAMDYAGIMCGGEKAMEALWRRRAEAVLGISYFYCKLLPRLRSFFRTRSWWSNPFRNAVST